MESQGKYDFAIFGENLAGWVAALLLSRQGDRVLMIPEKREGREFVGRVLFGLEPEGILIRMLEGWGLSPSALQSHSRARMECLTPETSLWIQGSLAEKSLGTPGFEFGGKGYEKLLKVVETMELNASWKEEFAREFLGRVRKTTKPRWRNLPFLPDSSRSWKKIVRRVVNPQAKGLGLPIDASSGDGTGRLIRGLGHLLYREESWIRRKPHPIQVASDFFALRNAYFSDEIFPSLKAEFRKILKASGVEFLDEDVYPHFKRDTSGQWEGFFEGDKNQLSHFEFGQMIFTRQLEPSTMSRFEDESKKNVEMDLQESEINRYEMEVRFRSNPFPFEESAELVSRSPSGGWVRLSVYRDPATSVRVGAWVPIDGVQSKGDAKIVAERRLLREIRESLPGLAIDSEHTEVSTEIHRERRFKAGIGVRGQSKRVWHAHHQSYPEMGEYGPVIAAIEIARRRARKKKRVLPI
ncbi:MAG: hypothetical protein H7301_14070 [Cryobacterium sp.]|nr:hypothetical protein [Oligoflexia bacterium]